MKSAIFCSVFASLSLLAANSFGQSCHSGGNSGGYPYGQPSPYGAGVGGSYANQTLPGYPTNGQYGAVGSPYGSPYTAASLAAKSAGPTARITVVAAGTDTSTASRTSALPTATLTVVADTAPEPAKVAAKEVAKEETEAVDSKIAGLAGTWKAVARHGDGELTTVELHLDNRGWAELTVPGTDGKPTTTKSHINLENEELKLTSADNVLSLGKLVDVSSHQMVLERAEGQVTFVKL